MLEMIVSIKDDLMSMLNISAFSADSIEGWIIIVLCLFLVYEISQKAIKFVGWLVGLIFLFQVGHWLSLTTVNDYFPFFSIVFKYDVLTAVAQCFVGTKMCEILLYVNSFIKMVSIKTWNFLLQFVFKKWA